MPDDEADPSPSVQLSLNGFEGPLDLLLELARRQAVDLRRISVAALVDQYLAATAEIARLDLALAADWLVMTAWLVWLKSRLLLPKDPEEARQAGEAAKVLTERLRMLDNVRAAAAWLDRRPQLGREMFGRGRYGKAAPIKLETDLVDLFRAALAVLRAGLPAGGPEPYRPVRPGFWTPPQAMARLRRLAAELPDGSNLLSFVPTLPSDGPDLPLRKRAAVAGTLVASLELARGLGISLHQEGNFTPILVRRGGDKPDRAAANSQNLERPDPA